MKALLWTGLVTRLAVESPSPTSSEVDKSEWSTRRFSLDTDSFYTTVTSVEGSSRLSDTPRRSGARTAGDRPDGPEAPSLWGGPGAAGSPEDGAERAEDRKTPTRAGEPSERSERRERDRAERAGGSRTAGSSRITRTTICIEAQRPPGARSRERPTARQSARPPATAGRQADRPERGAGANGAAHGLDQPSDPLAGSQRKTERITGDRREPVNVRWSR